jgi:1,2-diacylglycerol 3-alpha-glucosyltransferase
MRKYKIALITDWYYPRVGGIEYAVDALARHLLDRGHEVHIVTRTYADYVDNPPLRVIRIPGYCFAARLVSPLGYWRLYQWLKATRYEILHVHGLDSAMAIMVLLFAKHLKLPVVVTNHSAIGVNRWRGLVLGLGRWLLRHSTAVIAVSSVVEYDTRLMLAHDRLYRIVNGVDYYSPNGAMQSISLRHTGKTFITTVARMTAKKDLDLLLAAAQRLVASFPQLCFVLVGDGPERSRLQAMVAKMRLVDHVLFTGAVSRETVFAILRQSNIFVLPCRNEAFGIVILEAFSVGLPVIAMQQSGAVDIITHGETGLLTRDTDGLVTQLTRLLIDKAFANTLAKNALAAVKQFQWPVIAQQIEQVYTQVVYAKNRAFS